MSAVSGSSEAMVRRVQRSSARSSRYSGVWTSASSVARRRLGRQELVFRDLAVLDQPVPDHRELRHREDVGADVAPVFGRVHHRGAIRHARMVTPTGGGAIHGDGRYTPLLHDRHRSEPRARISRAASHAGGGGGSIVSTRACASS